MTKKCLLGAEGWSAFGNRMRQGFSGGHLRWRFDAR